MTLGYTFRGSSSFNDRATLFEPIKGDGVALRPTK
jgi:hypothetical protein